MVNTYTHISLKQCLNYPAVLTTQTAYQLYLQTVLNARKIMEVTVAQVQVNFGQIGACVGQWRDATTHNNCSEMV